MPERSLEIQPREGQVIVGKGTIVAVIRKALDPGHFGVSFATVDLRTKSGKIKRWEYPVLFYGKR